MSRIAPLTLCQGPHDHEGAGRERYHDQTAEQRKAALSAMVEDAGIDLSRLDPRLWTDLGAARDFARGWLNEHQRCSGK